jgi:hypothetical protein
MPNDAFKPETVTLHGGWCADPTTGSVARRLPRVSWMIMSACRLALSIG